VVSMFEAMQRKKEGKEIIQRKLIRDGKVVEDAKFLFSLCKGDVVYMKELYDENKYEYFKLIKMDINCVFMFLPIYMAKIPQKNGKKDFTGLTRKPSSLLTSDAKKCSINVLGEVQIAHD
ncbi:MAG: hypothetical protein ACP5KS_14300, partial [Candidatus Hydrogenedens sp.]